MCGMDRHVTCTPPTPPSVAILAQVRNIPPWNFPSLGACLQLFLPSSKVQSFRARCLGARFRFWCGPPSAFWGETATVFKNFGETSHVLTDPCSFSGAAPLQISSNAGSEWLLIQETHEVLVPSLHFMKFDPLCSFLDCCDLLAPPLLFVFFQPLVFVIVFLVARFLTQSQSLEISFAWVLVFLLCCHCSTPAGLFWSFSVVTSSLLFDQRCLLTHAMVNGAMGSAAAFAPEMLYLAFCAAAALIAGGKALQLFFVKSPVLSLMKLHGVGTFSLGFMTVAVATLCMACASGPRTRFLHPAFTWFPHCCSSSRASVLLLGPAHLSSCHPETFGYYSGYRFKQKIEDGKGCPFY